MPLRYDEYDGIVIGAGHNGMICAGYLGKCGQKIIVVEKNMEVGGGLDSHEDSNYPGFWHNIHSVFHRGLMMLPWYKDLESREFRHSLLPARSRRGASFSRQDLSRLVRRRGADGRNHRALLQEGRGDVHGHLDALAAGGPENRVSPKPTRVPLPIEEKRPLLEAIDEGREYLNYFDTTPEEFVLSPFRASASARLYRLSSASCAATSWMRRRPDI